MAKPTVEDRLLGVELERPIVLWTVDRQELQRVRGQRSLLSHLFRQRHVVIALDEDACCVTVHPPRGLHGRMLEKVLYDLAVGAGHWIPEYTVVIVYRNLSRYRDPNVLRLSDVLSLMPEVPQFQLGGG